jgi:ketosteroid isomerase-like protein
VDEIQATLQTFLDAFSKLDLETMISCFADDSTAFFPSEHQIERLVGKTSIKNAFNDVITKVKRSGAGNLKLETKDVIAQRFGEVAILTFQIFDTQTSRRTLVMKRGLEGWQVIHMHASNASSKPIQREVKP